MGSITVLLAKHHVDCHDNCRLLLPINACCTYQVLMYI